MRTLEFSNLKTKLDHPSKSGVSPVSVIMVAPLSVAMTVILSEALRMIGTTKPGMPNDLR